MKQKTKKVKPLKKTLKKKQKKQNPKIVKRKTTPEQIEPTETGEKKIIKSDVGKLVRYFDNGWRHGYLAGVTKKNVIIQPIGAKGGKKPHQVKLSFEEATVVDVPENKEVRP